MTDPEAVTPRRDPLVEHLACAEAAQMLMECLLLLLIEQRVLTKAQVLSAVDDVITTKRKLINANEHPEIATVALGILSQLCNSLAATDRGPGNGSIGA